MLFSESIPSKLTEYPTTMAFLSVLDELQRYKKEIISDFVRLGNLSVLTNKKWLLKKLAEFGVTNFPESFPLEVIQLYLLNMDTIFRTRGSKIGLELYLGLLTLGNVTIEDEEFYAQPSIIVLDSPTHGFITSDNEVKPLFLVDDNEKINPKSYLRIKIATKFYNTEYMAVIKRYIESTIDNQLGFNKAEITISYSEFPEFVYHKLLNPYFI